MSIRTVEDQFDWRGPGAGRGSFRIWNLFVSPKGQRVVPTSSGMVLIVVGLCIGLAAYNTENNILFAAFSIVIASLILSGIVCWVNFTSARWRMETSDSHRVGEDSEITVVVENSRERFPLFCLSFDLGFNGESLKKTLYLKDRLDPGDETRLVWRFKPEKRCSMAVEVTDVTSSFPFGFLKKHIVGGCDHEIIVWPAKIDYTEMKSGASSHYWQGKSSKSKGDMGELIGLRRYRAGDAPKTIHWKASARQQRLVVKENAAADMTLHSIYVDPSRYIWQDEDSFEKMCSLAASLAEDFFLSGQLDACMVQGRLVQKVKRLADLDTFLDELARLEIEDSPSQNELGGFNNRVVFKPTSIGKVGAFINGIEIAQA